MLEKKKGSTHTTNSTLQLKENLVSKYIVVRSIHHHIIFIIRDALIFRETTQSTKTSQLFPKGFGEI